jgi:hypothetical protein
LPESSIGTATATAAAAPPDREYPVGEAGCRGRLPVGLVAQRVAHEFVDVH